MTREPAGRRIPSEWILVGLAAAAAGVLLSASFFLTPLLPWPDQGTTLEAAINHSEGRGLVISGLGADLDITNPGNRFLTYFPPLYPLLVSSLLQVGLDPEKAVRLLNLLAVLFGCLGWCRLAALSLSKVPLWIFAGFLVLCGGAVIPLGGTADQILWAGVPFWGLALLGASGAASLARAGAYAIAASFLVGGLIGVRWASAFLVIAGCLFLVGLGQSSLGRRLTLAFCHGAPATAIYLYITLLNRSREGQGNYLDYLPPRWDFARLWTSYPLESLVLGPVGLDKVLRRVWQVVDPAQGNRALHLLFIVVLPATLVLLALRWLSRDHGLRDVRLWLAVCTSLTLVLFLGAMSVRYSWSAIPWSYLDEPRYFRPGWPIALLLWLAVPSRHSGRLPGPMTVGMLVIGIYLLQARVRGEVKAMRPQEWQEATREVLARTEGERLAVVFDSDTSPYRLARRPNVILLGYPDMGLVGRLRTARSVDVWIANKTREDTVYSPDKDANRKKAAALIRRFGAELVWRSSQGGIELFRARIPAPGDAVHARVGAS